jgi:peptide chain release factor subunit 1
MGETQLVDRLDLLARLEPTAFPLLSLYLNTDADGTGKPNHDVFLKKELRERVKTYPERSAQRESLEKDVERINRFVADELKPSTRGVAIFACSGANLFEAVQLEVPFDRNLLVVGDRADLYPLARLDDEYPRYAALVVNTNLARIFVFSTGRTVNAIEVRTPKTKHTKAGGWSQARFQRHVENVHLQHAKEVVERLDEIVASESIDHVVLAGDEVIVPLLREQLPDRLARKLVDVLRLDIRSPEHEVLAATLEALQRKDEETDEAVVQRLLDDYRAGGLAVVGPEGVRAALQKGQVDTLIISASPNQLRGDEATANELVSLAIQTSAAVRFIENAQLLAPVGGAGAALRYLEGTTAAAATGARST